MPYAITLPPNAALGAKKSDFLPKKTYFFHSKNHIFSKLFSEKAKTKRRRAVTESENFLCNRIFIPVNSAKIIIFATCIR